jgi:hypothetical protein
LGKKETKKEEGADAGGFIGEVSVQEGVGFGWRRCRSTARDRAVLAQVSGQRWEKTNVWARVVSGWRGYRFGTR